MSINTVSPLLDATIIQLNILRNLLANEAAACLIDAARAQLMATKQMMGYDSRPTLKITGLDERTRVTPLDGYVGGVEPDLRPVKKTGAAPKDKQWGGNRRNPNNISKSDLKSAVLKVLEEHKKPLSRLELEETILAKQKELGLKGDMPSLGVKIHLQELQIEKAIKKIGDRNTATYKITKKGKAENEG